jgi:hypothetical protein
VPGLAAELLTTAGPWARSLTSRIKRSRSQSVSEGSELISSVSPSSKSVKYSIRPKLSLISRSAPNSSESGIGLLFLQPDRDRNIRALRRPELKLVPLCATDHCMDAGDGRAGGIRDLSVLGRRGRFGECCPPATLPRLINYSRPVAALSARFAD